MLAKTFNSHPEVYDFSWGKDAELDAAQLLAGYGEPKRLPPTDARLCLQTTYLNERYHEYLEHQENFHLIWLIRNPHSVVYSMVYNWSRFALNEVFVSCGLQKADPTTKTRYDRFGCLGVPPIDRACYAYLGKLDQCNFLADRLDREYFLTIQYEELVQNREALTRKLYNFVGLPQLVATSENISQRSMQKSKNLSSKERDRIEQICCSQYQATIESNTRESVRI